MAALRIVARSGLARVGISEALRNLATPTYFPAVSSTCSTAPPDSLIRLLIDARYPRALISAFDCKRRMEGGVSAAAGLLARLRSEACTVVLDSGLFECQVLGESSWSSSDYDEVSTFVPHDLLFSFDGPSGSRPQHRPPPRAGSESTAVRETRLVHIVHGTDRASIVGGAGQVLHSGSPLGIAIPDREAGPDLAARVRTVGAVRRVINDTDETLLLHVLGCGNPVVMAAYTMAGADTFDSLDWAQGAVDIRSLTQTDPLLLRRTGCKCKVCVDLPGPDGQLALLHNLLFYQEFSSQLREMVRSETVLDFLQAFTSKEYAASLAEVLTQATSE